MGFGDTMGSGLTLESPSLHDTLEIAINTEKTVEISRGNIENVE